MANKSKTPWTATEWGYITIMLIVVFSIFCMCLWQDHKEGREPELETHIPLRQKQ